MHVIGTSNAIDQQTLDGKDKEVTLFSIVFRDPSPFEQPRERWYFVLRSQTKVPTSAIVLRNSRVVKEPSAAKLNSRKPGASFSESTNDFPKIARAGSVAFSRILPFL